MPPASESILRLSDLQPFAVGGRRLCFVHPHDPSKCVKVLRQDDRRAVRLKSKQRSIFASIRREYDNNAHEKAILEKLARQIGPQVSEHLPVSYGMAETDLGPGLVLDLIRDHDGQIARSLRELISRGLPLDAFRSAFEDMGAFFIDHVVLTRALLDHNLVAQDRGGGVWHMYMIDGFGDTAWLPLTRWIRPLGRAKIRRLITEAWPRFEKLVHQPVTQDRIESSSWGQGFLKHRG